MSHCIHGDDSGQDQDVMLIVCDLYTVSVCDAEPFLGHFCDPLPSLADRIFMIQDIALNIQIRTVPDFHIPAITQRGNQGLSDYCHLLPFSIFDFHRILDGEQPLLDPAKGIPCHIQERICFADAKDFAIHPEYSLSVFIFDPKSSPIEIRSSRS